MYVLTSETTNLDRLLGTSLLYINHGIPSSGNVRVLRDTKGKRPNKYSQSRQKIAYCHILVVILHLTVRNQRMKSIKNDYDTFNVQFTLVVHLFDKYTCIIMYWMTYYYIWQLGGHFKIITALDQRHVHISDFVTIM